MGRKRKYATPELALEAKRRISREWKAARRMVEILASTVEVGGVGLMARHPLDNACPLADTAAEEARKSK